MNQSRSEYLHLLARVLIVLCGLALIFVIRDLRTEVDASRMDTRCILHELNDHRQKNRLADGMQLEAVGLDPANLPTPPTLPDTDEWNKACDDIRDPR